MAKSVRYSQLEQRLLGVLGRDADGIIMGRIGAHSNISLKLQQRRAKTLIVPKDILYPPPNPELSALLNHRAP